LILIGKKGYISIVLLLIIFITLGFILGYTLFNDDYNSITGAATSTVGNLTANVVTAVACTWSNAALNVSFGEGISQSLSQGPVYNASKNFEGYIGGGAQNVGINWTHYNITADITNTDSINISIKGQHLLIGINTLGVGNITWMSNESNGNGTDASGVIRNFTYLGSSAAGQNFEGFNLTLINDGDTKLASRNRNFSNQLTAGSTVWFRFWLHVPRGQIGGKYVGNYTQTCTAATT